jgi:hypothetical protein
MLLSVRLPISTFVISKKQPYVVAVFHCRFSSRHPAA